MSDVRNDDRNLEFEKIYVRSLLEEDLDAIVRIDAKTVGRTRREYYSTKLRAALDDTGVMISLVAELDGRTVGFLMGQVFYGEFGQPEPVAIFDSIGVDPDFRHQGVARALMQQLKTNLGGLDIQKIQTIVDWAHFDLLGFLKDEGFNPAAKLCLECSL